MASIAPNEGTARDVQGVEPSVELAVEASAEAIMLAIAELQQQLASVMAQLAALHAHCAAFERFEASAQASAQAQQYDDGAMKSRRHLGDPDAPQPSRACQDRTPAA